MSSTTETPHALPHRHENETKYPTESIKTKSKKLRPLVITMGGDRKEHITKMFTTPPLSSHFHPPKFSPGIPSRSIRNRKQLLHACYRANILSESEWDAIQNDRTITVLNDPHDDNDNSTIHRTTSQTSPHYERKGRKMDLEVPYSVELWRKAKSLGRGRAVFACLLAHLIAIKMSVEDEEGGYDMILEDNVRAIFHHCKYKDGLECESEPQLKNYREESECAQRILDTIKASESCDEPCLLRYFGWLGSIQNVQYVYQHHIKNEGDLFHTKTSNDVPEKKKNENSNNKTNNNTTNNHNNKTSVFSYPTKCYDGLPGTTIWGAYAYWISPEAYYNAIIPSLRSDVGSMLWKGKRMRGYLVKPIDKILPRKIMDYIALKRKIATTSPTQAKAEAVLHHKHAIIPVHNTRENNTNNQDEKSQGKYQNWDTQCIHVTTHPAFYRAPMLSSNIHKQWDVEFCKSTEVQFDMQSNWDFNDNDNDNMKQNVKPVKMSWSDLWLTDKERISVKRREECGSWEKVELMSNHGAELKNLDTKSPPVEELTETFVDIFTNKEEELL